LPSQTSLTRRVVAFAFLTVFLDLLGFGIILPLLPFYVDEMGGSAETIGILFGCFSFTQLLATPLLGRVSDRFGRRRVILVSLAGNALSMLGFALASKLLLLPLLFASRIVAGATAGNIAACQAAVSDVTPPSERAIAMGRLGAGINLGVILGPLLAGALSGIGAWAPPAVAAAFALVDFACAFFLMPETRHLRTISDEPPPSKIESPWAALARWPIASVLAMYFLIFLSITNVQVALALLAQQRFGWGPREVAWLFTIFAAASFVVQAVLIGRLSKMIGEVALVIAGAALCAAGMLLIGQAERATVLVAAIALFGVGFGATTPVLVSLASQASRDDTRGFVLGMLQSSGGLARTFGPLLAGMLFRRVAPPAPFVGGCIASLSAAALAVTHATKRKGGRYAQS
jgi:DHA1 family tetracycline resistance protein-like MFS transporter